ncbi:MAG: hypothetical protein ACRDTD_04620 [Pseudonocardiaceae bacterium]
MKKVNRAGRSRPNRREFDLKYAFVECSFRETAISGCLSGAVFLDCDFADTEFEAASAKGCDLQMS